MHIEACCSGRQSKTKAAWEIKCLIQCFLHADQLERMAQLERSLAFGHTKPHAGDIGRDALVKTLIRYLVEEWL